MKKFRQKKKPMTLAIKSKDDHYCDHHTYLQYIHMSTAK